MIHFKIWYAEGTPSYKVNLLLPHIQCKYEVNWFVISSEKEAKKALHSCKKEKEADLQRYKFRLPCTNCCQNPFIFKNC